jgi:hypothetical protein
MDWTLDGTLDWTPFIHCEVEVSTIFAFDYDI